MRTFALAVATLPTVLSAQDSLPSRTVVPLPAIYYTPETGLALGAAIGLFSTPPRRTDGTTPPTSSGFGVAVFTTKSQLLVSFKAELWPENGRRRILASMDVQRFPSKYWGIGNDTPDSAEEDYTPQFTSGVFEYSWRSWRSLYTGVVIRGRWRALREASPEGLLADSATPGVGTFRGIGLGYLWAWDTRNKVSGPTRGTFLQFRREHYYDWLTTGGRWGTTTLDWRAYLPLLPFGPDHTLATQLTMRSAGGAPFDQLPQLGGDALLRGYYEGRFRDRTLLAAQAEYRGYFVGPVGFAFGGGIGQVAPGLGQMGWNRFHAAIGGGLRVMIDAAAGLALRVDWASATDGSSSGLYISAGEAF
ncbi:MAG: BamA/TamA family outer membrane protein [Gemmatimonadales bacterium]